jgi:hypothetical protein
MIAVASCFGITLMTQPTEDYPGPTKGQPEKEGANTPPRRGNVDPVSPPLPEEGGKSPRREEKEEEKE